MRFSAFPKIYFDAAEIYRRRRLEESGPRLLNVDRTHLVIASWYYKKDGLEEYGVGLVAMHDEILKNPVVSSSNPASVDSLPYPGPASHVPCLSSS